MNHDYYQILGVSRYAAADELKKAYKKLAKEFHPDKHQGSSYHEEQFKLINEAYQVLSDAEKKRMYDWKLLYNSTPYTSNTTNTTAHTTKQQSQRTRPRKKPTPPPEKNAHLQYKYFLIIAVFLILIGAAGTWFYGFMNRYTSDIHMTNAIRYYEKAKYKEAYFEVEDAIEYNNELAPAYLLRGKLALVLLGRNDKALQNFTNAISASDSFYHEAYFERAKVLIKLENYPSALNDLNELMRHPPVADSVIWLKAEIHYYLNDYVNSNASFEQMLLRDKNCGDCLSKLIDGTLQLRQFRKTVQQYEYFRDAGADTSQISPYIVAISYLGIRDSVNALKYFELLDDGSPQKENVDELLKSLNEK